MAGTVKMSSSTEDASSHSGRQQQQPKTNRPFVFGYDFQTSSSETTPRGIKKTKTMFNVNVFCSFKSFINF